jgi:hypothetical protein
MGPKKVRMGVGDYLPMGDARLSGIAAEDIASAYGIFKKGTSMIGKPLVLLRTYQLCRHGEGIINCACKEVRYNKVTPEMYRSLALRGRGSGKYVQYTEFANEFVDARDIKINKS